MLAQWVGELSEVAKERQARTGSRQRPTWGWGKNRKKAVITWDDI